MQLFTWQSTFKKKKGKGFLFNVGSRWKPESLFPAEPMAGALPPQHPV